MNDAQVVARILDARRAIERYATREALVRVASRMHAALCEMPDSDRQKRQRIALESAFLAELERWAVDEKEIDGACLSAFGRGPHAIKSRPGEL